MQMRMQAGEVLEKLGKGISASSERCYLGSIIFGIFFTKSISVVFGVVLHLRHCRVVIGTVNGRLGQCRVS